MTLIISSAFDAGNIRVVGQNGDTIDLEIVADEMPMQIVDPLEMIQVKQEQNAGASRFDSVSHDSHELASVPEAGDGIRVGVAMGSGLGGFVGVQCFAQVPCAAPSEQDDRDIEDEGDP